MDVPGTVALHAGGMATLLYLLVLAILLLLLTVLYRADERERRYRRRTQAYRRPPVIHTGHPGESGIVRVRKASDSKAWR